MQAIVQSKYGSPNDVLALDVIDAPAVKDSEVLVQVRAAAVSIGDWLVTRGLPYFARTLYGLFRPKNRVPGFDVAGYVEAVGRNVKQFRRGDEVFVWCNGAFAEYVSVSEESLAPKPANLTLEQAAVVPTSAMAGNRSLSDLRRALAPNGTLVIVGGSGGPWLMGIGRTLNALLVRRSCASGYGPSFRHQSRRTWLFCRS